MSDVGQRVRCPKCGRPADFASTSWHVTDWSDNSVMGPKCRTSDTIRVSAEHLHRECDCGFEWGEPTKDAGTGS